MKNNYSNIIFDLDGTLSDSRDGIINAAIYAAKNLELPSVAKNILLDHIGIPLQDYFAKLYNTSPKQTNEAVKQFREYYAEKGAFENTMYPGIFDLLHCLKKSNKHLFVATAKYEKYAMVVLDYFKITGFFSGIVGADASGIHADKTTLVKKVMSDFNIPSNSGTIMIGDKNYDIIAAKNNNIDSLGVTYGFGSIKEINEASPTYILNTSQELYDFFIAK